MDKDTISNNIAQAAPNGDSDAGFIPDIPQGASLEEPPKLETGTGFPDAVFEDLPDLLWRACNVLTDPTEREVFLVSALGVVSGTLPNVRGFYDGGYTYPNLYVYLLGQYGTGKGGIKLAAQLARPIHKKKREQSAQLLEQYKVDCIAAKDQNEPPPLPPGNKMHFIPANNSKSGLVGLLAENDGEGTVLETEGDTMAQTAKTEYGNYSDVFRKAFHHETITSYRKTGNELRDIETPRLSMVLTSTYDQLTALIPNIQNGLFSRFLYYRLSPCHEFKDVFDPAKRAYPEHFDGLGQTFLKIYDELDKENYKENPIDFDLRPHQKDKFLEVFKAWKSEVGEYVSTDLDGTVNRLGLICFRVAMILTAVRSFADGDYSNQLCDDVDFNNAVRIVEVLKRHAIAVFYDLPNPAISREAAAMEKEFQDKATDVGKCRTLENQGKNYTEISKITGIPKTTVYRWLTTKTKKQ